MIQGSKTRTNLGSGLALRSIAMRSARVESMALELASFSPCRVQQNVIVIARSGPNAEHHIFAVPDLAGFTKSEPGHCAGYPPQTRHVASAGTYPKALPVPS